LPKVRLQNVLDDPPMAEAGAEIVEAIVEDMAADAAEAVIMAVTEGAQVADPEKATARVVTDLRTKGTTADPIPTVRQHVLIPKGEGAGLIQEENPGTRNKPGSPGRRKRDFSL